MLSVKQRQSYLKKAGYYTGEIDGTMSSIRQSILKMKKDYSDVMSKKRS